MQSDVSSRRSRHFVSRWTERLIWALLSALATSLAMAQVPAFPGALGFGSYATGGRNGTVYHVTNLNDSGVGSFRDAVSQSGRTIVFDVGGEIKLLTAVGCSSSLTIAGQTAPGGIVFNGAEISFANRNNIICRYIRIRPGSDTASTTDDALSFYRASNVIVDHSSIAFAPWNNIDGVGDSTHLVTDITVQNSINANPTGQQFGCHAESVGGQWSWQYNIFANSHNRNPLAKVNDTFINNLEYNNDAGYTTHTSTPFKHDIVNNYFIAGPASGGNFPWYQIDKNQSIYYTGNLYDSDKNGSLGGSITTPYWYQGVGTVLSSPWSSWTTVIPTMTPALACRYDVSAAGAFPRDEVDSLIISQINTLGTGGPGSGLYTSQTQTGLGNNGYGTLAGLAAIPDTDGDGMPDYWELATGSDPNAANPLTNTLTGYTLLENYLNYLAAPHGVTQANTAVDISLRQFTSGFSAGATFSLSNATNGTVTFLNGTNAHFVPSVNFSGLGSFNFTINDGGLSLAATVTVCITPVLPPASATNFNGALVGVSLAAAPPPANLLWRGDGTVNTWSTTASNWLNGSSLVAFHSGDVVTLDDTGSNTPALSLSGTLSPGAILFNDDQNYTIAGTGAWSGSGSFTKTGPGTLTIGTINSGFSGAINLSDGTISLNPGTSLGSGPISLSGGATLNLAGGGAAISIPGSITVPAGDSATINSGYVANGGYGKFISGDSTSVLNFNGNQSFGGSTSGQFDSFNGTINISSGNIRFSTASSGNTFGSLNPNFIINGTLQPRNAGNTIVLGALNGSGSLAGPQTANTGAGNTVFKIGGNNQDAIFSGNIVSNANSAGSAICLNKVGTGTQTLAGNNTFTGTNAVLAGALLINGTTMPSQTTVFGGATLGGTGVINGPVTVNNGGILSPGGPSTGTLTINGSLTNNSPILNFSLSGSPSGANDRINMTGTLAMTGTQTFNFNLADNALGAGTYNLIEGADNSTQSGMSFASNLPGNTRQNITLASAAPGSNPSYIRLLVSGAAGSLVWRGTNGVNWDTSTVNWANGSTADVFYNLDSVRFDDTGANPSGVNLTTTLTPAAIVVDSSQNYVFGGPGALAGSGPLTKTGSGRLLIETANTAYNGPINLGGGTLVAGNTLGGGTMTISNGAAFSLPAGGPIVFFNGNIMVPAGQTGSISSSALVNGLSGNLFSGNSASVLNLTGDVSFGGTSPAQFDGFTGTINIPSGTMLRFSADTSGNTFGSASPSLIINGTLQPRNAGNTVLLGAFSGSGTLAGPQSNSGTGDTLYVIGGSDTSANFGGNISSNSAVAGSQVSVNKIGSGMLTLTGASTFTGGTTISAGTLRVNNAIGSATGTGDLEIFSGATLAGSGIISSPTTIDNGGTLAPGDTTGTLTISNNLTLNDGSLLQFALGTNSDRVVVSGDLALTGQLSVTNSGGFGPGSYPLFTCGESLNFGSLTLVSAPAGYNYSFDTNTTGTVKLVVALPSPPFIGGSGIIGGNFIFSGSGGMPDTTYYVATSTNLAATASNWTRILTNQFDGNGNFSVTNQPATNVQSFYRLELPLP